ncbi:hypothetical protein GLYMA_10G146200v4 [Glycine max]|nr:hypothetical protein GLYMA_10G146200v4 [Glycine max]KAH1138245.1 hypothetical protein GYH30_028010 [Glycine max]
MAWLQLQRIITNTKGGANLISPLPRFFSKCSPYVLKVGIPEFLNGIGKGVESHVPKLESEIGDFQKLLVIRTLKLKKLGIPCKHLFLSYTKFILLSMPAIFSRKLILKYTHKYRLGLWRPRAEFITA